MRKLTVELETVTPLFLAGAEARGPAELRAPSFRGALRYWLRAIAGIQYREIEAGVFGDTDSAGLIATRVAGSTSSSLFKKTGRKDNPSGFDYLFWSMNESGKKEKGTYQGPHQYIPAGSPFQLTLMARESNEKSQAALGQAYAALWLLLQLGGIGSRSRRTGGSLVATHLTADETMQSLLPKALVLPTTANNATNLTSELKEGIATARQLFKKPEVPYALDYDVLSGGACRVWVLDAQGHVTWKSAMDAINAIGTAMREFRSYREPDHHNVAPWLSGNTPASMQTVERAVFGLPLPFRYSDGGPSGVVQGRSNEIDRRASPLWLHVTKLPGGSFVGVATLFKSPFLPHGERLYAKGISIATPPDYSLIEQFIAEKFACREVTL